jgi:hypothetical protein
MTNSFRTPENRFLKRNQTDAYYFPPNKSLDASGGSAFRIKRDSAKRLGGAPPGQLNRYAPFT